MSIDVVSRPYLELFGADGLVTDGVTPADAGRPALVLCFTNRSGSNYVAELLRSTRLLPRAREVYQPLFVRRQLDHWREPHIGLAEYSRRVRALVTRPGGSPPVFKVGWQQLHLLADTGVLDTVFPERRLVLISRDDLLGQVVSFAIARRTGAWESGDRVTDRASVPEERPENLWNRVGTVLAAAGHVRRFAAATGDPLIELTHESVAADPQGAVDRVLRLADLPRTPVDPEVVTTRRQRDTANDDLAAEAVAAARRLLVGPPRAPSPSSNFPLDYDRAAVVGRVARCFGGVPVVGPRAPSARGAIAVVAAIETDARAVGRWLSAHPDTASEASFLLPDEPEDADPAGLEAHLSARLDTEARPVVLLRPGELSWLLESRVAPHLMELPSVVAVRRHRPADTAAALEPGESGLSARSLAAMGRAGRLDDEPRAAAAVFGLVSVPIALGSSLFDGAGRRARVAGALGLDAGRWCDAPADWWSDGVTAGAHRPAGEAMALLEEAASLP